MSDEQLSGGQSDDRRDYDLPFDSDVEVDDDDSRAADAPGSALAVHHRPGFLLLVGAGGAAGTLVRFLLQQAVGSFDGVPVITALINVTGAFLLGLLLETLVRRGEDHGRRRMLRLLLGTGVLGGYTTYSALSVDTLTLLRDGQLGFALLYAFGTVVVGAGATVLGIVVGARVNAQAGDARAGAAR